MDFKITSHANLFLHVRLLCGSNRIRPADCWHIAAPPSVTSPPEESVQAARGSTVTFTCQAVGVPTPIISWRLNWGHIPASGRWAWSETLFGKCCEWFVNTCASDCIDVTFGEKKTKQMLKETLDQLIRIRWKQWKLNETYLKKCSWGHSMTSTAFLYTDSSEFRSVILIIEVFVVNFHSTSCRSRAFMLGVFCCVCGLASSFMGFSISSEWYS